MWKGGATRGHRAGPADRDHHRHQVRGQLRAAPGRALPAALRHRRPSATRRDLLAAIEDDDYLEIYREQAEQRRHLGRLGPRAPRRRSPRRRTTACSTSATPSRSADRGRAAAALDGRRLGRRVVRRQRRRRRSACSVGDGDSVGSSNAETTIVTVVPSGASSAGRRALLDHRAPSARRVVGLDDVGHEAGLAQRLLGLRLLHADDVRDLLGPVGVEDRDHGALARPSLPPAPDRSRAPGRRARRSRAPGTSPRGPRSRSASRRPSALLADHERHLDLRLALETTKSISVPGRDELVAGSGPADHPVALDVVARSRTSGRRPRARRRRSPRGPRPRSCRSGRARARRRAATRTSSGSRYAAPGDQGDQRGSPSRT